MSRGPILQPGTQLGRYRLVRRLGAGGMAEVFLARLEGPAGFARQVAIKVVHPDTEDDAHLLALVDEARLAAVLSHPNIVRVHELERLGDGFYLVMDYIEGRPLDELLRAAQLKGVPPSLAVICDLGLQVLDALSYAHSARDGSGAPLGLVHRDIKPSNLMVDPRGLVTVVDFGIARASTVERRTATGAGKGTPAYMAPEQLHGRPVQPSSDLFALAVVLYEMATGRRLFTADSLVQLVARRGAGYSEEDRERLRAAMPELEPVLAAALAQDPGDRPRAAEEMAEALRRLSAGRARVALQAWGEAVGGVEPAPEGLGPLPKTRVAGVAVGSADRELPATRAVRIESVEPAPTRAMEGPPVRRRAAGWVVGAGLAILLVGVVATVRWGDSTEADPDEGAPVDTAVVDRASGVDAVAFTAEVTPVPEAERSEAAVSATPAPGGRSSPGSPAPTRPPASEPTPERSPTPTPTVATSATSATPAASASGSAAAAARSRLYVNLTGDGGQAEVAGSGRHSTPHWFTLPEGAHALTLLDAEGGRLADFVVQVRGGAEHRCIWLRQGAELLLQKPEELGCSMPR